MFTSSSQVLALAPDAQVASDGQRLGRATDWASLGGDERVIWGEILGSGSKPYRVSVDLRDGVAKCSCPSRKFPCKHAVGRMLVHVSNPRAATGSERPDWTETWIAARDRSAAGKASDKPVDEKAQAKRREARVSKVDGGMAEFGLWLHDMAARGLASVAREDFAYWDRMAARLVDAQAPALARRLRAAAALSSLPQAERGALADEVGRLWMICRAWERRDRLSPALLGSLRAAIGFAAEGDGTPVVDTWTVLGQRVEEEDDGLRSRTTWLGGALGGDMVPVVDYAPKGRGFPDVPGVGRAFSGTVLLHPGATGRRATLGDRGSEAAIVGFATARPLSEAMDAVAALVGQALWIVDVPMCVAGVRFGRLDDGPALGGDDGYVPVAETPALRSHVVAAGGLPVSVFGTWNGHRLSVMSTWTGRSMFAAREGADYAEKVA